MATLIRAREAAAMLDVSMATLYAYVSRGRVARTTGPDGRTSLFSRDEVEELAARSRRSPERPRSTIDVQVTSEVTTLDEGHLGYRGHDVVELVRRCRFEDVAELLWSGAEPVTPTAWAPARPSERATVTAAAEATATPIGRLAIAAHLLHSGHLDDDAPTAARQLLRLTPAILGGRQRTGTFAEQVTASWRRRPSTELVGAIDAALVLLADHELATSTLAVRIAASVRTSPYVAFAAGFAAIEGALHGSASHEVHRLLEACADEDAETVVARLVAARRPIPGFGHKVYRQADPRFAPLLARVRALDGAGDRLDVVDDVVAQVGRRMPHPPNVDLALGALTWTAGLASDAPIFAVARIAGWAAHYDEELAERPVRFRGIARPPLR